MREFKSWDSKIGKGVANGSRFKIYAITLYRDYGSANSLTHFGVQIQPVKHSVIFPNYFFVNV